MAYTKQTWQDLPSKTTPINASRLGHIEQGIYDAASTADTAASDASSAVSGLADKVDKVKGKGLSTNDFTDALKTKLDNIESGAEVNVQSDWNEADSSSDAFILNKPTLGTASTKNSTSVVTQSTDLVESGAVKDIVGWGNKNELDCRLETLKALNTHGTWSNNVFTRNGISYTVNSNLTITINGTCSNSNSLMYLTPNDDLGFIGKHFGAEAFSNENYGAYITSSVPTIPVPLEGVVIPSEAGNKYRLGIRVIHDRTVNNVVFKPMVCDNNLLDKSYEPFHLTVDEQKADNSVIAPVEDGTTASQAYAVGEHFIRDGAFCTVISPVTTSSTWTLGSNYVEGTIADNLVYKAGDSIVIADDVNYQIPIEGYFTSAGKTIFIFIRTDKPLINVTGLTFNESSKIYLRGVNGYILNGAFINTLNVNVVKVTTLGILVALTKTDGTAFNETDSNKTVNIALLNCTVTLS